MIYAVIGLGSIGKRHLNVAKRIQDRVGITAIRGVDTNPGRREEVASSIDGVEVFADLTQAVEGAEIVVVCTPTASHIDLCNAICEHADPHIFIEKPLSHTLEGCDELIFNRARAGKQVAVGYFLRYHPMINKLKAIVDNGELGRVLMVRAESGYFLPKWHPWEDYRDFYMSWKTGGGGVLLDTSHEINYMQYIFGEISDVSGFYGTVSDLEITSDDMSLINCRFKNGIYGHIHLDLLQFEASRTCKVIGTEGVCVMDLMKRTISISKKDDEEWKTEAFEFDFNELYDTEMTTFAQACASNTKTVISADHARATMDVVEAVRRSHSLGSHVRLPLYG